MLSVVVVFLELAFSHFRDGCHSLLLNFLLKDHSSEVMANPGRKIYTVDSKQELEALWEDYVPTTEVDNASPTTPAPDGATDKVQQDDNDSTETTSSMEVDSSAKGLIATEDTPLKVEFEFGSGDAFNTSEETIHEELEVDVFKTSYITESYRFMHSPLAKYAGVMEERFQHLRKSITEKHNLEESELSPLHIPGQEEIVGIGMVCSEDGKKLSPTGIILQGSRESSERVRLDLRDVATFTLFPGQIIGVKGVNSSGKRLFAKQIFEPPSLPVKAVDKEVRLDVVVASGPFTSSENLRFSALHSFLEFVQKMKPRPQVAILVGPFVDVENNIVSSGCYHRAFHELFNEVVSTVMSKLGLFMQVFLVPSLRDVHHDMVFPQPAFNWGGQGLTCLANPTTLSLSSVVFGVSSTDVLKDLASFEISRCKTSSPLTPKLSQWCVRFLTVLQGNTARTIG